MAQPLKEIQRNEPKNWGFVKRGRRTVDAKVHEALEYNYINEKRKVKRINYFSPER